MNAKKSIVCDVQSKVTQYVMNTVMEGHMPKNNIV